MWRFQNTQLVCTPQQPKEHTVWLQEEKCTLGIGLLTTAATVERWGEGSSGGAQEAAWS